MQILEEFSRWLNHKLEDDDLKTELNSLNDEQINDAFYRDLEFGTGGLRGIIGAGTNRVNIYTVAKATQGLADYINNTFEETNRVVGLMILQEP